MSNDQLGWEKLLNPETPEDAAKTEKKAAETVTVAAPETASVSKKTPAKKTRAKKSTAQKSTELFAKKDWSSLAKPPAEKASLPAQEVKSASVTITTDVKTEVKVQSESLTRTIQEEKFVRLKVEPLGKSASPVRPTLVRDSDLDDALDGGVEAGEPEVLSVSELNRAIRSTLEGGFPLVWLKAEISNFKAHTSGHFYFSLKDAKAQISAVMFRGYNAQLRFAPEDGMEVLVRGKVTVYEPRGNYQIFCEVMEPVGAGALQKAFEQLKAKLAKEGLFDQSRKRPLPALPKHIAIVTSPTGAAIRDMLNVLGRRFKGVRVTVVPCKVQGREAANEIVAAIELANKLTDVDVMIVGRGGGSIEDMWCFNEEKVARAIASARVPVISAVGHEIDFTIADFVADLRAPTPSAAAELVVKNAADLSERVSRLSRALRISTLQLLASVRQVSQNLAKRLVDPQRKIQDAALRCDELAQRLTRLMQNSLRRKEDLLQKHMAVLDSLSPLKVLDRGYSMVVQDGNVVTDATSLKSGDQVTVRMCKGSIEAEVKKINSDHR